MKKTKSTFFVKDDLLRLDNSDHSPHTMIPPLIKPKTTVLDVGCNIGMLAKQLKDNVVDGLDINTKALKKAQLYCRKTFKRDLYSGKLNIPKQQYDYIVFADILEHLPRPDLILIDSKKYLKPNGQIIVSLPNIARFELRIMHLFGKFEYAPGIMGSDHLRFFTYDTALELFEHVGYKFISATPTGLGHKIGILPKLTAFQFIFVCKK